MTGFLQNHSHMRDIVTAAIKSSLARLDQAVGQLEGSVVSVGTKSKTPQKDLFGAVTAAQKSNGVANDVDPRLLARRLDSAISKVEQLLKEGRA